METGSTLEIHLSNWDPDLDGSPGLCSYQATIDSSTYASGSGDPLTPLTTPDPSAGAFIDQARSDYVFFGLNPIAIVSTAQLDYSWIGLLFGSCKSDGGANYYSGTLILEVPSAAAGSYTVQLDTQGSTILNDCTSLPIPSLLSPAVITIAACGDGIANVAFGEQCDGADDAACPGFCQADCTCLSSVSPPLVAPYPHDRRKNRYISFDPDKANNDGTNVAFKFELAPITLGSCSGPLGDPPQVDFCRTDRVPPTLDCNTCIGATAENSCINQPIDCVSGTCTPTGETCVNDAPNAGGSNVGTVWWVGPEQNGVHLLVSQSFRKESTNWANPVHVGDCEIVPEARYGVRAVEVSSGTESAELLVETTLFATLSASWWGDCVGPLKTFCGGDIRTPECIDDGDCTAPETCDRAWTLPDGSVNFDDVNAALALVAPGATSVAPDTTWVDLHGNATGTPGSQNFDPPNFVLNFSDIGQILSGFGGFPYKGYDPADCPDSGTWP